VLGSQSSRVEGSYSADAQAGRGYAANGLKAGVAFLILYFLR
jgi:hypothetical protein